MVSEVEGNFILAIPGDPENAGEAVVGYEVVVDSTGSEEPVPYVEENEGVASDWHKKGEEYFAEQDYANALHMFNKAAEKGNPE